MTTHEDTAVETEDARLATLERKLDEALAQQRALSELVTTLTPVAKDVLGVLTERLGTLEERGYFRKGKRALAVLDTIVTTYSEEDVAALGDNVVLILDTVRNLTQPDVLAVANDAGEAIHQADGAPPLGRWDLLRSTGDEDVQRGVTLMVEVFRQIGRARRTSTSGARGRLSTPTQPAPVRAHGTANSSSVACSPAAPPPGERATTEWEGRMFYEDGFLVDPTTWTPELATKIAGGLGIALTDEHWKVVRWARSDFEAHGASPNVRRVASGSGVGTRAVYELFPGTPGKSVAMVAGIPKPVGCI